MSKILPPDMTKSMAAATDVSAEQRAYVDDAKRVHERSAAQAKADMAERHAEEERGRRDTTADHARTRTIKP